MKLKRFRAGAAVFLSAAVLAGCSLLAGLSDIDSATLAGGLGGEGGPDAPLGDGKIDTGAPQDNSWCSKHATDASVFCDDFDLSLKGPTPGSSNSCSGQVINGAQNLTLPNSLPNVLSITCTPNTSAAATDDIFYGYKIYYPAPNGLTIYYDVYLTPYDDTNTLMSLFRVGLADGAWWMEYDYSNTTAVIKEFTSTTPLNGSQIQGPSYPVPQMNMSTSPGWYHMAFSIDLVRNLAWLSFNIEPNESPSIQPDGSAETYTGSFPITTFGDAGTAAAWDFAWAQANIGVGTANSYIEVRWGLNTGNSTFQQNGSNLTLNYDNVDFEAIPAGGIDDAGPIFPPK